MKEIDRDKFPIFDSRTEIENVKSIYFYFLEKIKWDLRCQNGIEIRLKNMVKIDNNGRVNPIPSFNFDSVFYESFYNLLDDIYIEHKKFYTSLPQYVWLFCFLYPERRDNVKQHGPIFVFG